MDFKFSDREEFLKKTVGDYADKEIPPHMEAMEETGEFRWNS